MGVGLMKLLPLPKCGRFVAPCRNMHLLDEGLVVIDGSKFKAVNNSEKNFTHDRLKKRMQSIEDGGHPYMADLVRADRQAAFRCRRKKLRL